MKKEKVFALLLTAVMCATTVAPVAAADFSDQITAVEEETNAAEAGAVAIKGTVQADNDSISGTIPAGASPYRYKVTLPTGGNLSLKGESSSNLECFIMDERENEIGKVYNFDKAYELAQGNYIILIRNNSTSSDGNFSLRTYFTTQGATTSRKTPMTE